MKFIIHGCEVERGPNRAKSDRMFGGFVLKKLSFERNLQSTRFTSSLPPPPLGSQAIRQSVAASGSRASEHRPVP